MSSVRLYGVMSTNGLPLGASVDGAQLQRFREMAALLSPAPFRVIDATEAAQRTHEEVIERAFRLGTVLPAPFGTVFQSADQVRRWMEMNYIALGEGISFVEGRCEARVYFSENSYTLAHGPSKDVTAMASECFRALRRISAAAVPLKQGDGRPGMSGAFLLARERWGEFLEQLGEQARRFDELAIEQSGPWPPYDFVKLDLGA